MSSNKAEEKKWGKKKDYDIQHSSTSSFKDTY